MFITIVVILFCIAFLLSLRSLHSELKKNIKTHEVAASLAKGRVLFIADSSQKNQQSHQNSEQVTAAVQSSPHTTLPSPQSQPQPQQTLSDIRHELSQINGTEKEEKAQ